MAGGWGSITDDHGRYYGAGTMDTGGDVEEFARSVFGMVNWLGAKLEEVTGVARAEWIVRAERGAQQGFALAGQAEDDLG